MTDDHDCGDCKCGVNLSKHITDDQCFVWSTSHQAKQRAKNFYIIRCIVEKFGGTVSIDLETNVLDIDFPDDVSKEDEAKCALEVEEAMSKAGYDVA